MKTISEMDIELEQLGKLHKETWGRIVQLQNERNFVLQQLARETARSTSTSNVQLAQWNSGGHVNHNFDIEEILHE
jgi:hypothetical protein